MVKCDQPGCDKEYSSEASLGSHKIRIHGIYKRGPSGAQSQPRQPVVKGELIDIGPMPNDPVTITIRNGSAERTIRTWVIKMADVVDLVTGALRGKLERRG